MACGPRWGDTRVKAVVVMAGDAYLFNEAGLAAVRAPMMALGGTADFATPWEWGGDLTYRHVASRRKALGAIESAGHMIFTNPCSVMPWTAMLEPAMRDFACLDPVWDKLRTLDLTNHLSTAFLLETLAGDAEAKKALTLEAVTFPGVTFSVTQP